jgi:hypothetical protein
MKYSKGVMWLDDCRIPFVDEVSIKSPIQDGNVFNKDYEIKYKGDFIENTKGRFTPNLLVCDDMLNDGSITKQSKRTYKPTENMGSLFGNSPQAHGVGIGDSGSSSRYYDLDKWFDKVIDEI